jgi:hypothetical protein
MRVHRSFIDSDGEPFPNAFRNQPKGSKGMSVDWSEYAKPIDTKNRANKPHENAVIKFTAGDARNVPNQIVEHKPVNPPEMPNQAHSEVIGDKKDVEVRERFMQIYAIEIPLDNNS